MALAAGSPDDDARRVDRSAVSTSRTRPAGLPFLVISGLGFPLSQMAIRRLGRSGAAVVVGVTTALLFRDAYLVSSGAPRGLRPVPAALLYLELGTALMASVLGLLALTSRGLAETTVQAPGVLEVARRVALGTLFGLHTWRFAIYVGMDSRSGEERPLG